MCQTKLKHQLAIVLQYAPILFVTFPFTVQASQVRLLLKEFTLPIRLVGSERGERLL